MGAAEELREAAKLMRECAQAATPGPWSAFAVDHGTPDAKYIAGMHPGVALAVADLLDKIAWMGELDPDMLHRVGGDEAIAIARVYLGGSRQDGPGQEGQASDQDR